MSLILNMLGGSAPQARDVNDERYWGGSGLYTSAGVRVGPDTALRLSTAWACVSLLSETMATLSLNVYERLPNSQGRDRARKHPLYHVLRREPNENQTAFEYWQMKYLHLLTRGNAYSVIQSGRRGFADQLIPHHPDAVQVSHLKNGKTRYDILTANGWKKYHQDEVFHLRGLTANGKTGLSVIDHARESMGISLAAERYGAKFFANDSTPGGLLKMPGSLGTDARKRLKQQWEESHAGGNSNRVAVLEDGLEWQSMGITNTDAQFLESREFQAEEICRWFRVPPVLVGLTSKSTSWGSGIEQMGIGFVRYTLNPWLTRVAQAVERDLILNTSKYYVEHMIEGLLRGELGSRYDAYAIAIQNGWMSPNETRAKENMNPRKGGDVYLTPMNMEPSNALEGSRNRAESNPHYQQLATESAARLVRKEIAALSKGLERTNSQEEWEKLLLSFYDSHAELVCQSMAISHDAGIDYTSRQIEHLTALGSADLQSDEFKASSIDRLLEIMEQSTP